MQPPILTFDGLDLVVLVSKEEAEAWVEPADVDVGPTYDAAGHVLRFETDGRRVFLRETGERQPDALREAILATFHAADVRTATDPSLSELVTTAAERFSLERQLTWLGRAAARFFSRE